MRTYILAGNYKQAVDYAYRRGLTHDEWDYVLDGRTLLGAKGGVLLLVGTYYDRDPALLEMARARGMTVKDRNL